jgi:Recombination endonuclease VII
VIENKGLMALTIEERRARHAAYMRKYNSHPDRKAIKQARDKKYYDAHLAERRAYDQERVQRPERQAQKLASQRRCREANREAFDKYHRDYYQQHKERWVEYNGTPERKTYMTDYLRKYGLYHKYGIAEADYNDMFDRQRGVCAICKQPPNKRALHVDHDHVTGQIRGLLCTRCNNSLERLEKFPGWATSAEHYLTSTKLLPKAVGA